jgi:hypothetical protein
MELAGLGNTGEAHFKQRLEQSRFSKKKSMERWKGVANVGVGWLKGGSMKDDREHDGWVWDVLWCTENLTTGTISFALLFLNTTCNQ